MDPSTLIALAVAAIIFLIGMLVIGGGTSVGTQRARSISSGGQVKSAGLFSFLKPEDSSSRRKAIEESLGEIEARQKSKTKNKKKLKSKLLQANLSISPQSFIIMSVGLGVLAGGLPFIVGVSFLMSLGLGIVVGFGLPRWILGFMIGRRQKKFTAHFADAMDIIVRGVRTGLPLGDCLKMIAYESPEPVKGEFLLVVEGESVGVPIEVCLERMYERMDLPEVNFFATVLNIQRTSGGNLGESLANLSNVLRGRKLLREKIKALAAEAKMSSYIIAALPVVVMAIISIASPDYMTELYTTKTGHRNLMVAAAMMVMGTLVMRKMINFKI